jgi:hypothetical protein
MLNSDIIIETDTNQFKFLSSDSPMITIYYQMLAGKEIQSVCMSKGLFMQRIKDFCNDPRFEKHYANFSNIDQKGLTSLP